MRDFPGSPVVKNPPCYAEDSGSSLARELRSHMVTKPKSHKKISHMMQQRLHMPQLRPDAAK